MADWKLSVAGGAATLLDTLNVSISNIDYISLAPDSLSITVLDDVDATGWSYGDEVILTKDAANWFQGVITRVPHYASGEEEVLAYEVSGPWWYLDNICYKQLTGTRPDGSDIADQAVLQYTPTCILGQREDASYITTSEQIQDILTYATDGLLGNAPINVGNIFEGIAFPTSSVVSTTCGDAIRQLLRYHPDVVSWFDYSGSTPQINFERRSGLSAVNVDMEGAGSVRVTSRDDLVPSFVEVIYEITGSVNGEAFKDFSVDKVGAGPELGGLSAVVNLRGDKVQIQRQRLRTKTLPSPRVVWGDTGVVNPTTAEPIFGWVDNEYWGVEPAQEAAWEDSVKDFWRDHTKWIENVESDDWTVDFESHGMKVANLPGDQFPDEDGDGDTEDDQDEETNTLYDVNEITDEAKLNLPREIVGGNITPWMKGTEDDPNEEDQTPKIKEGIVIARANLVYTGSDVNEEKFIRLFPNMKRIDGTPARWREVEVRVRATDGITKIYQNLQGIEQAETVPEGVAQSVMDSLSSLQYEGEIVLVEEEVTNTIQMGDLVNITNGRTEWATMEAMVQNITQDVNSGTTAIYFGPPSQLSPQTYADLLRFIRTNPVTYVSDRERTEGKVGSASEAAEAGYKGQILDDTSPPPGAPHPFKVEVAVNLDGTLAATVHPGFVWIDQGNNTTPDPDENYGVDKMWPTLGAVALNATVPPSETVTTETICQLKFTVASEKVSAVEVDFAASAGTDTDGTRYRTIATLDLTTNPTIPVVKNQVFDSFYYPTGATGKVTLDYTLPHNFNTPAVLSPTSTAIADVDLKYENGHWVAPELTDDDSASAKKVWDLTDYEEVEIKYDVVTTATSTTGCTNITVTPWRAFVLARKSNTEIDIPANGGTRAVSVYDSMDCDALTWKTVQYVRTVDIDEGIGSGNCTSIAYELAEMEFVARAADVAEDAVPTAPAVTPTTDDNKVYVEPCADQPT